MEGAKKDNEIGPAICPVCRKPGAALRVSKNNLAYIACRQCPAQTFARGDQSDMALRAMLQTDAAPAVAEVVEHHAPAPAAPATVATVEPNGARRGMGWGVLG